MSLRQRIAALIFTVSVCAWAEPPALYVFENGLGFGADGEEAAFVRKSGYAGVSQIHGGGDVLAGKVAAYEKEGIRVLSVYRDVDGKDLDAAGLRPLAGKGALIELTVRKITPDTPARIGGICALAETLDMKVALYPHHGFAIATMPQAMEMVSKVDHPRLGVMFNLCHFLKNEDPADLEKTITAVGAKLFAVSVNGADEGGKDWVALIRPLGEGDFPMQRLLAVLRKSDFKGPVALQCHALKGDKRANLKASIAAWKSISRLDK
ncbi:sugar phosphate isomerase/epimerase [Akkermansiaceae bacterium]|nr:sugar phosphate isomerase/epimerase [Akkermansiaceae bacterium]